MKPGDLVRVSKSVWNGVRREFAGGGTLEGQIGMIIDVEKTPPFLDGEMFVVLVGGVEQRFYDDELAVIDEAG